MTERTFPLYSAWTQDPLHPPRTFPAWQAARAWVEREAPTHCGFGFVQGFTKRKRGVIHLYSAHKQQWSADA